MFQYKLFPPRRPDPNLALKLRKFRQYFDLYLCIIRICCPYRLDEIMKEITIWISLIFLDLYEFSLTFLNLVELIYDLLQEVIYKNF